MPKWATLGRTCGNRARGTAKNRHRSSSQQTFLTLSSRVREALLASVAWTLPRGQVPDQPAIDGAARQLAGLGPRPQTGCPAPAASESSWPRSTDRAPNRSTRRSRSSSWSCCRQNSAGAAILPDDGPGDRPARRSFPEDDCLTLIGQPDGDEFLRPTPGPAPGRAARLPPRSARFPAASCSTQPGCG